MTALLGGSRPLAARPPTVGRVILYRGASPEDPAGSGPGGESPAPLVRRVRGPSLLQCGGALDAETGRGLPEDPWAMRHGLCGSLWMIGRWLSLSQDIRGSTESDTRGMHPYAASLHDGRCHVIGGWYPPTEGRMEQCGPAFSVANPHVCPGPTLGELSGGKWMARRGPPGLSASGGFPDREQGFVPSPTS